MQIDERGTGAGLRAFAATGLPAMLLLLLSTSSLLSLAPTRVGAQGTASLVGIVLNDADRTPIGNARVMLTDLGREIRSDEDGRFSLTDLPSGWLSLRVERDDFVTLVESVGLVPDEASTIQVHLRRVTALLDSLLVGTPGPGGASGAILRAESRVETRI